MNINQNKQPPPAASPATIRRLTPEDAEACLLVRLQALREQPPAFSSTPQSEPPVTEIATRLAAAEEHCFFGAFQAEQLIGIVRLSFYSAPNEKHRAYLGSLYVLPSFRGRGCGRLLINKALNHAASLPGIRRVNLSVVTIQTAALSLYHSFGFQIYGTEVEAFSNNDQFYDEHLMTLDLKPASSKS